MCQKALKIVGNHVLWSPLRIQQECFKSQNVNTVLLMEKINLTVIKMVHKRICLYLINI